jgi:hypothetical protein
MLDHLTNIVFFLQGNLLSFRACTTARNSLQFMDCLFVGPPLALSEQLFYTLISSDVHPAKIAGVGVNFDVCKFFCHAPLVQTSSSFSRQDAASLASCEIGMDQSQLRLILFWCCSVRHLSSFIRQGTNLDHASIFSTIEDQTYTQSQEHGTAILSIMDIDREPRISCRQQATMAAPTAKLTE